ncbi:MAG: hypothetical protein HPM95_07030 [Alphaproteobacteria bacterium]|nr:hypothetical protein [Alphaproteobacteria bacterium]
MPPAEIRLNIPHHSRRENCAYEIPDWLEGLKMVRIVRDDAGPATSCSRRWPASTPIRRCRGRRRPHLSRSFLADLSHHAQAMPDAAFGLTGWVVPADFVDRPTTIWSISR